MVNKVRENLGPDHPNTLALVERMAEALKLARQFDRSVALFRDVLAARTKNNDPHRPDIQRSLGECLVLAGKPEEAELLLREALTIRARSHPDLWSTFDGRSLLGASLLGQGKYEEAEPLIVSGYEGIKAREATIPAQGQLHLSEAAFRVVRLYRAWGRPDKAAEWKRRLSLEDLPADVFANP